MKSLDFVFWLEGFLEIGDPKEINEGQIKIIQDHINLVLNKTTPTYGTPFFNNCIYSGVDAKYSHNIEKAAEDIFPKVNVMPYKWEGSC